MKDRFREKDSQGCAQGVKHWQFDKCDNEGTQTDRTEDALTSVCVCVRAFVCGDGKADLDLRDPAILTELKPIALLTSSSMFDTFAEICDEGLDAAPGSGG